MLGFEFCVLSSPEGCHTELVWNGHTTREVSPLVVCILSGAPSTTEIHTQNVGLQLTQNLFRVDRTVGNYRIGIPRMAFSVSDSESARLQMDSLEDRCFLSLST